MRSLCNNREPGPAGPVVAGPVQAAAAVRLSAPPAFGPAIVVLLCGAGHRLILSIAVESAPPSSVRQVIDLVLAVAEPAGVSDIVVGLVQRRLSPLPAAQAEALRGLARRCDAAGVDLLDIMLVGPRGFRSVYHLAARPGGGEDGRP